MSSAREGSPQANARLVGQIDKAIFDRAGLRMKAHELVALRLVPRDGIKPIFDQLLDQLGPRGLVLDQHHCRTERFPLLAHRALEAWIVEPFAQHVQKVEPFILDSPRWCRRCSHLAGSAY